MKLKLKNTEDILVHPNIIFYCFFTLLLISFALNFALYFKFIHPIACKRNLIPTTINELNIEPIQKPANTIYSLYPTELPRPHCKCNEGWKGSHNVPVAEVKTDCAKLRRQFASKKKECRKDIQ